MGRTDDLGEGSEDSIVSIRGALISVETKGGEMYFVQNLNFMCSTIYCNLFGEFVWTA